MYHQVWLKLNIKQNAYIEREATFGFEISVFLIYLVKYSCLMKTLHMIKNIMTNVFQNGYKRSSLYQRIIQHMIRIKWDTACEDTWAVMRDWESSSLHPQRPRHLIPDGRRAWRVLKESWQGHSLREKNHLKIIKTNGIIVLLEFSFFLVCLYAA